MLLFVLWLSEPVTSRVKVGRFRLARRLQPPGGVKGGFDLKCGGRQLECCTGPRKAFHFGQLGLHQAQAPFVSHESYIILRFSENFFPDFKII